MHRMSEQKSKKWWDEGAAVPLSTIFWRGPNAGRTLMYSEVMQVSQEAKVLWAEIEHEAV